MPRKGEVKKRAILADSRFGDKLVAKFINTMMSGGKKSVMERIFYGSFDIITDKTKGDAFATRFGAGIDFYVTNHIVGVAQGGYMLPFGSADGLDYVYWSVGLQYRF